MNHLIRSVSRHCIATVAAVMVALSCLHCTVGTARVYPPSVPAKPYLRLEQHLGDTSVWVVDGPYVRKSVDEKFTNFGQHYRFPFIPYDEFWLDEEETPGEAAYFIAHLDVERRLMMGGMDYAYAVEHADAVEQAERNRSPRLQQALALLQEGHTAELMGMIHKQRLDAYSEYVSVWVVDGELVRGLFFVDFTEGGHDRVYDFVPPNELWLDDDVRPDERLFILLHEMHERGLMLRGWTYDNAHTAASRLEWRCRKNPDEIERRLAKEMARNKSLN